MRAHEPIDPRDTPKLLPWLIYLLIDPTTEPTNHPRGTVFYVGNRLDLTEPVDVRELTEPESIPAEEEPARNRLRGLIDDGVDVIIEVISDSHSYGLKGVEKTLRQTIGALTATLYPRPLNVRDKGILWGADIAQAVGDRARLEVPPNAILHRSRRIVPLAELVLMSQEEVFAAGVATVRGLQHTPATAATLKASGPRPLLFLVGGHARPAYKVPIGFVLGAWMVDAIVPVPGEDDLWQVVRSGDTDATAALQRHYVHRVVNAKSSAPGPDVLLL